MPDKRICFSYGLIRAKTFNPVFEYNKRHGSNQHTSIHSRVSQTR